MQSQLPSVLKAGIVTLLLLFSHLTSVSQSDTSTVLSIDFDEHQVKETNKLLEIKNPNSNLTYDRFGNKESALQLNGTNQSYLSLGTSDLVKSPNMSISMWVKINTRVYLGKGYESIPILITKNGPGFDYVNALVIVYDCYSNRLSTSSTKDSLNEVIITYNDTIVFNRWYHLVTVCNNNFLDFYINGKLIGHQEKKFETTFMPSDSMIIGHTASTKNERYMRGIVDDIKIFHKPLTADQVLDLYNAPNPNRLSNMLNEALKYLAVIVFFVIIIILIIFRNKRQLKKQKEELELGTRIAGLELKAIKSQMNPHFISNSLAAIQELNYNQDKEKAGLYIAKFSYFLRQILNYSDENYISVSEEIVMMRLFVELEQLRFNDGFSFDLMVEDHFDTEEVMIPSLITQPFIENAIWHGLLPLKNSRAPKLIVRIMMKNGFPVIEIEDNGVGRSTEIKPNRKSKGTQLVMDKIDALNRLAKTANYKINIVDLFNEDGLKFGTKIIIQLENIKE